MELSELIAQLLEKFRANGDEVFAALQQHAHPLYQRAFDAGHQAGANKIRGEKATVDTELATAKAELQTVKDQLKELQDKTPDLATVRTQYQNEIKALKDTHKTELAAERTKRVDAEKNRAIANLQSKLGKGLRPLIAKLLVQDDDVKKRIVVREDGTLEVMQKGKDIPFSPSDGQDVLDLLATELIAEQPADLRLADGDNGSGVRNGTTTQSGGANEFDSIRQKAEAERKSKASGNIKSLDEKLGLAPASAS